MNIDSLIQKKLALVLGILAGVVGVNLAVYFLAVSNLDKHAKSARAKVAQLREQVKDLEKKDKEISGTVSRVKTDRQVVDDLAGKILTTRAQRLVAAQTELQNLLEGHKLQADSISYDYEMFPNQETFWGRRYLKVGMGVPLSGGYQDIKGFIKDAQASPQFFLLEDVGLSAGSQGGVTLRMTLRLSTYFVATDQDLQEQGPRGRA